MVRNNLGVVHLCVSVAGPLQSVGMENGNPAVAQEAPLRPITLEKELRKDPLLKEQDVTLLRDWVSMQPHLPPLFDRELVLFLHTCNYSVEAAKAMADSYFTMRTHLPEFFSQRDPTLPQIRDAAKQTVYAILPKTTPDGYVVFIERIMSPEVNKYDMTEVLKLFTMVLDQHLHSVGTSPGLVYIMDMKGITLAHLTRISIVALMKFRSVQESLLVRMKGIHYINVVPFVDKIMNMIKPFMKDELNDMTHLHVEGSKSIFEFVPQDILPEEYGGCAPPLMKMHERMQSQLLANREFFLAEETRKVDEQKRPGRPRSAEDLFGVEGTFRKLDID